MYKLAALVFVALSIGACGRTGELTPVKQEEPAVAHQHQHQHQHQMKETASKQAEPVQETLDFIPQSPK